MKFCPQCGNNLMPGGRFCQECGFVISLDEPADPAQPISSEPGASEPFCPQCGTALSPGVRFCENCGFDTTQMEQTAEEPLPPEPVPEPPGPEILSPVVEEPANLQTTRVHCPQCGAELTPEIRFCIGCGFDSALFQQKALTQDEEAEPQIAEPPLAQEVLPPPAEVAKVPGEIFCPVCGTKLSAGDRYCDDCGFDTAVVQQSASGQAGLSKPQIIAPAEVQEILPSPPVETVPPPIPVAFCPQCGAKLTPDIRFCEECGFDTAAGERTVPVQAAVSGPQAAEAAEVQELPPPSAETVPPPTPVAFCPQCGAKLTPDIRFCEDCGFDTLLQLKHDEEGSGIPESIPSKPIAGNIPPVPERVIVPPAFVPPPGQSPPPVYQPPARKSKAWLWILLAILGLGVLGVGGWFGYNKFMKSTDKPAVVADTAASIVPPVLADTTQQTMQDSIAEDLVKTEPEKQATVVVKKDDRITRPSGTTVTTPVQTPQTPAPAIKQEPQQPEQKAKTQEGPAVKVKSSESIFIVRRNEFIDIKSERKRTRFPVKQPTMVTRIVTDHYNQGNGDPAAATISIKDKNDNPIGQWPARSAAGNKGTAAGSKICEPNILLQPGVYFIYDSKQDTWSMNIKGGCVEVFGYTPD